MKTYDQPSSRESRLNTAVGSRCSAIARMFTPSEIGDASLTDNNWCKDAKPAFHRSGRSHGRSHVPSRLRGSALLLTLVCLVMMVLLGTAYVQIARVDRRATRQIVGIDNMGTVRDAVLQYIAEVLRSDIVGPGANANDPSDDTLMFNNSTSDTGHFNFIEPAPADGNIIEGYDYPYTNRTVTYPVLRADGSALGNAYGGVMDDTWLAAAHLNDGTISSSKWQHLSNLNGIFLRLPKQGSANKLPIEIATGLGLETNSAAGDEGSDGGGGQVNNGAYGILVAGHNGFSYLTQTNTRSLDNAQDFSYERAGIDTDKDGISDGRPTWAPEHVRQIGSSAYVVTYRIIDTSSMINLNVASAYQESATSPSGNAGDDPGANYGLSPSDIDMLRVVKQMSNQTGNPANFRAELNNIHANRGLNVLPLQPGRIDVALLPSLTPYSVGDQVGAWAGNSGGASPPPWGGQFYGYENNKFGSASEIRLRMKNGVVPAGDSSPVEDAMPGALRKGATESYYRDNLYNPGSNENDRMNYHGTGGRAKPFNNLFSNNRKFPSLRNFVTVYSGAVDFAPRVLHTSNPPSSYAGTEADDLYKVDLVNRFVTRPGPDPVARLRMIQERLYKVFTVGNTNYLNMTDAECQELSIQWALNIVDYSDTDHEPSKWPVPFNGRDYYGLEIMPYLKEVYLQIGYEAVDKKKDDGMGTLVDYVDACETRDMMYDGLELKDDSRGLIVELGNPHDRPVDMTNNRFSVALTQGATRQFEFNLSGQLKAFNPNDLTSGKKIYVMEPTVPVQEGGKGGNLTTDIVNSGLEISAGEIVPVTAPIGDLDDLDFDQKIEVELRVKVGGTDVVYDKMTLGDFTFPEKYTFATQQDMTTEQYRFYQMSERRAGEVAGANADEPPTIGYLSNVNKSAQERDADSSSFQDGGSFEKIGIVDKGITPDTNLTAAKLYIRIPNRRILNVAELGYIFSGGGFSTLAGNPLQDTRTLADTVFGNTDTSVPVAPVEWHYLTLPSAANAGGLDVPTDLKVAHVAYLFDHFTCLSSGWDGLDTSNTDDDANVTTFSANESANDAAAHDAEHFIPGRLNVNTAPWHLAASATALPEGITPALNNVDADNPYYADLYYQIRLYRDEPNKRHQRTGNMPTNTFRGNTTLNKCADYGIASIGEIMLLRMDQASVELEANILERDDNSILLYAASTDPKIPVDDVRKIYPSRLIYDQIGSPAASAYTDPNPATGYQAGLDGDWPIARDHKYREQDRMVRFHFINPTLSVRSDTFVAYFEIRAYNAGDFSTGASDTKSYVALFDRSNVRTTEDLPEIVTFSEQ